MNPLGNSSKETDSNDKISLASKVPKTKKRIAELYGEGIHFICIIVALQISKLVLFTGRKEFGKPGKSPTKSNYMLPPASEVSHAESQNSSKIINFS